MLYINVNQSSTLASNWPHAKPSFIARMIQFVALALLPILASAAEGDTKHAIAKLHDDLFANGRIDPMAIPSSGKSSGGPIIVEYWTYLMSTLNLDELQGLSTINLWSQLRWTEPKLKWNPIDYSNVTIIRVNSKIVWKPIVAHYGSVSYKDMYPHDDPLIHVYNTGEMVWVPPTTFNILCELDHQWFPYDEHTCRLSLISWTHSTKEINLTNYAWDNADYQNNPMWELTYYKTSTLGVKNSMLKNIKYGDYPFISYELRFRRRPTYYQNVISSSAAMAAALMITVFCIPSNHLSRRFAISTCSFFIMLLLILQISILVPFGGKNAPRVYHLCNALLIMAAMTFPLSAILFRAANGTNSIPVPFLLKKISETRFNQQIDVMEDLPGEPSTEWRLAASALDRIFIVI